MKYQQMRKYEQIHIPTALQIVGINRCYTCSVFLIQSVKRSQICENFQLRLVSLHDRKKDGVLLGPV